MKQTVSYRGNDIKIANTGKRIHCDFGRTANDIKCTRTIWIDENGVEYIKHKEFVDGIAPLDALWSHMLSYYVE